MDGFHPHSADYGVNDTDDSGTSRSRDSLFLLAHFRVEGSPDVREVRVRNLSAGGLMAELEPAPADGTAVEIMVRGIGWIRGRIAWYAEGRAGIAFDQPIDPLLARKPVGPARRT